MARHTYYVAMRIENDGRTYIGRDACPQENAEKAKEAAEAMAKTGRGAVAFSRTGDPVANNWSDPKILGKFGKVPRDLRDLIIA